MNKGEILLYAGIIAVFISVIATVDLVIAGLSMMVIGAVVSDYYSKPNASCVSTVGENREATQ